MIELAVSGRTYRITGKLDAFQQLFVARRLMPVLPALAGVIKQVVGGTSISDDPMASMGPVLEAFGKLTDADLKFIIMTALNKVSVKLDGGTGFAPVASGETLAYQDLQLPIMIFLTWKVIEVDLKGFGDAVAQLFPDLQLPAA